MSNAEEIIKKLALCPHPSEGGYFARTYTSDILINEPESTNKRSIASAIYYLLAPQSVSRLHSLEQDEIWHFYAGDPVEVLLIKEDGSCEICVFGNDILNGQIPQLIIKKGTIFGARLISGGKYALFGATLSPEFCYEDYHEPNIDQIISKYPQHKDFILSIMRK